MWGAYDRRSVPPLDDAEARLREAIERARPRSDWSASDAQNLDLVQHGIARWVGDLGRSLGRADRALTSARADVVTDAGIQHLEEAFSQVVAARDKLVAITAQVFGVASLRLYKRSVSLEPKEGRV